MGAELGRMVEIAQPRARVERNFFFRSHTFDVLGIAPSEASDI